MNQQAFTELAHQVAAKYTEDLQQQICNGTDNPSWQSVKQLRDSFGNAVLVPVLVFINAAEAEAYRKDGAPPTGLAEDGRIVMGSVDLECFDEFCEWIGYSGQKESLRGLVKDLIEQTNHTYFQPVLTLVSIQQANDTNGKGESLFTSEKLLWWETEADTIPVEGLTKEFIREQLQQRSSRILELNPRDPMQAGTNINLWMDVAEELQLSVLVNAETTEILKHIAPRHQDKVLAFPFSEVQ